MTVCTIINTGCRWLNHNHQAQRLFGKREPDVDLNAWLGGQLLMFYWLQSLLCLLREAGTSLIWRLDVNSIKQLSSLLVVSLWSGQRLHGLEMHGCFLSSLLCGTTHCPEGINQKTLRSRRRHSHHSFLGRHFQRLCHRCECFIIFVLLLLSLIFLKKSNFEIQFVYF